MLTTHYKSRDCTVYTVVEGILQYATGFHSSEDH